MFILPYFKYRECFCSNKGNLKVTGEGATYENKQWKLGDGEYTISGTAHVLNLL